MPTKKPRVTITLTPEEHAAVNKIADKFGMPPAVFSKYCIRFFLYNYQGDSLPKLKVK